jgi:signal peptidase I
MGILDRLFVKGALRAVPLRLLSRQLVRVNGESMSPALRHGKWIWVDRTAYRDASPRRFDIVRIEDSARPGRWAIKRIVGLPGETVMLDRGLLTANGERIEEPHLSRNAASAGYHEWRLTDMEYVVLGDNRDASTDSRHYGPVRREAVLGRVLLPGR